MPPQRRRAGRQSARTSMKSLCVVLIGLPLALAALVGVAAVPQAGHPIEPSLPLSFTPLPTIGGPGPVVPPGSTTSATDTAISTANPGGPQQTTSSTITDSASLHPVTGSTQSTTTTPVSTTPETSPSQTPGGDAGLNARTSSILVFLTGGAFLYSVLS